jgi:hypothetical protein
MIFSPVVMSLLAGPTAGGNENASGNSYLDEGRLFSGERIAQSIFQRIRQVDAAPDQIGRETRQESHSCGSAATAMAARLKTQDA